jgi:metallophosphoesterase (TIGR00282 family)|tara:strand:- start:2261 stop:3067 length:807 start_codon:yes stop_codon:yes gene_type:complete
MKIMILGDIFSSPGVNALVSNLEQIIKEKNINFVIANGENAAENGLGITEEAAKRLFSCGVDVITSGNHIWDKREAADYIAKEPRLLRPQNLPNGSPGRGYGIYFSKCKNFKIAVLNLMGNVFMKKTENVFNSAKYLQDKIKLKKDADFIVVDFHGETTSEKQAMGHYFDGKATALVGTHTHVPTADTRVLENGTGYQTDIGMCGDYNSVIGMNKNNSLMKFFKDERADKNFPAKGEPTISGVIVEGDTLTGLSKQIDRFILGGVLKQ